MQLRTRAAWHNHGQIHLRRLVVAGTVAMCLLLTGGFSASAYASPVLTSTSKTTSSSAAGHIVASGPGFVIVGEGSRVTPNGPLSIAPSPSGTSRQLLRGAPLPLSVTNCGWVTCSLYLSVMQTQSLYYAFLSIGGVATGAGGLCALLDLYPGVAGVLSSVGCYFFYAMYLWNFNAALTQAGNDGYCLRIRYGLTGLAFFSDASQYCQWD